VIDSIDTQIESLSTRLLDLECRLQSKSMQLDDISTMGLMLTSILDIEKVLSGMMEMAIRTVDAEVGCFMLRQGDELKTKISWGLDDRVVQSIKMENDVDIATWTMQAGETVLINEFPEDQPHQGMINAIISAPVSTREKLIGVLVVVNKSTGGPFEEDDKTSLESIVRFAAVAIENAHLLQEQLKKQKLEQELALASQVQRALLPAKTESFDRAIIEASYTPAGQVGGDYYDLIRLSDHELVVIVGDVSNKGVPAALMMAAVRSVFRMEAGKNIEIHQLISELNSFLCDQVLKTENMFISLIYAYLNLNTMSCTYVNDGHLPSGHYHAKSKDYSLWKTGGIILGQFPDFDYKSECIDLEPGDRILFYTDGINESMNVKDEMFGRDRLHKFVVQNAQLQPQVFTDKLVGEVMEFSEGAGDTQFDDITTLLVDIR